MKYIHGGRGGQCFIFLFFVGETLRRIVCLQSLAYKTNVFDKLLELEV